MPQILDRLATLCSEIGSKTRTVLPQFSYFIPLLSLSHGDTETHNIEEVTNNHSVIEMATNIQDTDNQIITQEETNNDLEG